jgi:Tfp pilus assembly protein PilZ
MQNMRHNERYNRQYFVVYSLKNSLNSIQNSRLIDISKGGLKFPSLQNYPVGTEIIFHIKFPFLFPDTTRIEGKVVGVQQLPQDKSYKTNIVFINLDVAASSALDQMEKINHKAI